MGEAMGSLSQGKGIMLIIEAPAKLNLTLEVLGKRPDGYHEIRSVMQTVSLHDKLSFQPANGINITSGSTEWKPEESLVSRAVSLVQRATSCSRGAAIEMEKHIPLVAGLGGDSSDAAATLRGLNQLWELGLSQRKLLELAAQLGSDVPFFIDGGTALAEGRGELLTPLTPHPRMWFVLVVPDVPRLPEKTKRLYASLKPEHFTDGHITQRMIEVLKEGKEVTHSLLFNIFENIAFAPGSKLRLYRELIARMGTDNIHLAGSGPSLFSLVKDEAQADDLYTRCKDQGMEAYVAGTRAGYS
ncbi:4-(cytidine 5'-diphospho)-2-C-methyl-D-erythritol kinase [Chloroflexota bacterium]